MFVSGSPSAIQDFRTFLSNSHCDDFMNRLGWHFVIPISCNDLLNPETIMMTKCPDRCAISTQDAARALATFAFLLQIRARSQIGSPPFIPCQFQLFNDYVWKGQIGTGMTLEHFDHAWTRSCRIFSEELPLRYIVFGKQMPIDMSFAQFLNESLLDGREMRIHAILRLTGGGPINLVPNEQSLEQDAQASSSRAATGSDDRHDLFYLDKHYFEDAIQMAVTQWRTLPGQKDDMKSSDYLSMQCNVQDGMLIWSDSLDILFSFVRDIKENAIELMLDRMGWMMAIQFVAWEDPIVARLIMFPRPTGQVTSLGLARHFLQKALLRYALPYDSQHDIESRALIRVHSAGNSLAQLAVNRSMRVSELTDSWEHSCQIVGFDPAIRILICGKQASREFLLSDYAKVNENGDMFAYIHFVNPLKGGGPGPSDTPSSAKNHLASVLLEEAANIAELSTFVSALGKSGPMAIAAVLAPKDRDQRIKAIQKLANSLSIDLPALHTKEKFVKKKIQQHVHSAESLDICQLCIQQGFFRNEDGTPAQQRECPQIPCRRLFKVSPTPPGATSEEVQKWLTSHGWEARPLRSLANNTWLCGCENVFSADFSRWNDRTILVKWLESKKPQNSWLVAGTPKLSKVSKTSQKGDPLPPLQGDPWANWHANQGAKSSTASGSNIPRKVQAPVEERFQHQQEEFAALKEQTSKQIEDLKQGMQTMQMNLDTHKSQVKDEFDMVRNETKQQFQHLNDSFTETLRGAMQKQDTALGSQIAELKNLLLNRPNPQKKLKAAKPPGEDEQDDSNL